MTHRTQIVSVDIAKAFTKIQHRFMIKELQKLEIKAKFLNLLKKTYEKPIANIKVYGERLSAVWPTLRTNTFTTE